MNEAIWKQSCSHAVRYIHLLSLSGRPKPRWCFLSGLLRQTALTKERYGDSFRGLGSNTLPSSWEADTLPLSVSSFIVSIKVENPWKYATWCVFLCVSVDACMRALFASATYLRFLSFQVTVLEPCAFSYNYISAFVFFFVFVSSFLEPCVFVLLCCLLVWRLQTINTSQIFHW